MIVRIGGKELIQLALHVGPRVRIVKNRGDDWVPQPREDVVVADKRKDFRVFVRVRDGLLHLVARIDAVHHTFVIDNAVGVCRRF